MKTSDDLDKLLGAELEAAGFGSALPKMMAGDFGRFPPAVEEWLSFYDGAKRAMRQAYLLGKFNSQIHLDPPLGSLGDQIIPANPSAKLQSLKG